MFFLMFKFFRPSHKKHLFTRIFCIAGMFIALAATRGLCAGDALVWESGRFVFTFDNHTYIQEFSGEAVVDACALGADVYVVVGAPGAAWGHEVRAYRAEGGALRVVWTMAAARKRPWRVRTADVDGDGAPELALGVFNKARFHPVDAKRPFIFNLRENGVSPKWLGSRLSRPFMDFAFLDVEPPAGDELIAVEINPDGTHRLAAYSWNGFGFTLARVLADGFAYESFEIKDGIILVNEAVVEIPGDTSRN